MILSVTQHTIHHYQVKIIKLHITMTISAIMLVLASVCTWRTQRKQLKVICNRMD